MKKNGAALNLLLCAVVGLACVAVLLVGTFAPAAVLPELNLPTLVLLSLFALVGESLLVPAEKRGLGDWALCAALAAATLGLLPWTAGLVQTGQLPKLALLGGVTFLLTGLLFSSVRERLSSGPACRFAPVLSAGLLFLASQCLTGILL